MPRAMVRLVADHASHLFHDLTRPVIRALRGARVQNDDVGNLACAFDGGPDFGALVAHDVEGNELPAPRFHFRAHEDAVRLEVAAAGGELIDARRIEGNTCGNELVARGDEGHAGLANHRNHGIVARAHARCDVGRHDRAGSREDITALHGRARRTRARTLLRGSGVDGHVLLVFRHLHVLDDDGSVEPFGHRDARVRELPIHPADPCACVGQLAFREVLEIGPVQGDRVHRTRERGGHVAPRDHVIGEHAPHRIGERHLLAAFASDLAAVQILARGNVRPPETCRCRIHGLEHRRDRLLTGELDMLGMISHSSSCSCAAAQACDDYRVRSIIVNDE